VDEDHRNWDDVLPVAMFAYRTSVQSSTGFSPYFLMHGREARIPADLVYGSCLPPNYNPPEYVKQLEEKLRVAFGITRSNLKKASEQSKHNYDLRVRPVKFNVGDKVWYLNPKRVRNRYPKWQALYEGPFEIMKIISPVTFLIKKLDGKKMVTVHIDKLKKIS